MSPLENVTGTRTCAYCANDGLVVVNERRQGEGFVDEMGPCPHCEKGRLIEFPDGDKPGYWGAAGYWRGRSTGFLQPILVSRPLAGRDQREQVQQLVHTMLGGTNEPTVHEQQRLEADVDF